MSWAVSCDLLGYRIVCVKVTCGPRAVVNVNGHVCRTLQQRTTVLDVTVSDTLGIRSCHAGFLGTVSAVTVVMLVSWGQCHM